VMRWTSGPLLQRCEAVGHLLEIGVLNVHVLLQEGVSAREGFELERDKRCRMKGPQDTVKCEVVDTTLPR
jgi:hypothetical protein